MNVAVLGTGILGAAIAERLLACGHGVAVWNRTRKKMATLVKEGARGARNPADAIEGAEGVILLLADARAIRKTLLSASARKRLKGKTVIQMGTIGPSESRQLAKAVQKAGGNYLEAPVLGSVAEARSGTLHVMAGGTREPFERWLPVLKDLGEEPVLVGTTGKAAAFKLGLNQLIASLTASFGLSLAFIQSQGVEVGAFMKVLRKSALYALAYDKKLPRMLEHDYKNPNFPTRHLVKDIDLFLREARGGKLDTAALQGVRKIVSKAIGKGYGAKDYSALFEAIRR